MTRTKERIAEQQKIRDARRAAAKKQLRIWIEPEEYDAIKAAADAEGKTLAGYILPRVLPDHTGD